MHTTIHKIDKHQGFTVEHRELYSISYNKTIMEKNQEKKECGYIHIYV